ncbi:amino acid ABC transporter permease [Deferribacterales bacterium RsTz2092]|nr:amino acid ABC transporter permease [Deferribacterales bacterium]
MFDDWADLDVATFRYKFFVSVIADERWQLYLAGLGNTIILALVACLMGSFVGTFVAFVRYIDYTNKQANTPSIIFTILGKLCNVYTTSIRGTPLMIQLLILYTVAFKGGFEACIFGFGINSGAYISEIIRAGLMSIPKGQSEAGCSLGMTRWQTLRIIILPQAVKNILPALFNEFISLLKETSIAGYIAVRDLTKAADGIKGRTFQSMPLFITAFIYLALVMGLTRVQERMERTLAKDVRH